MGSDAKLNGRPWQHAATGNGRTPRNIQSRDCTIKVWLPAEHWVTSLSECRYWEDRSVRSQFGNENIFLPSSENGRNERITVMTAPKTTTNQIQAISHWFTSERKNKKSLTLSFYTESERARAGEYICTCFCSRDLLCEPRQQGVHKNYVCTGCECLLLFSVCPSVWRRAQASRFDFSTSTQRNTAPRPGKPCLLTAVHNNLVRLREHFQCM